MRHYINYIIKGVLEVDANDVEEAEMEAIEIASNIPLDYTDMEINVLGSE